MNLMAKSCFCPGLIAFVSNLITSASDINRDMARSSPDFLKEAPDEKWLEEYIEGMSHEIYRVKLSEKLERRYFVDIARLIYKKTTAIVFAIEVHTKQGKGMIRLNPNDFLVSNIQENDIHVYAICPDKVTAESIETIEMTREEKSRYFVLKDRKSKEEKIIKDEHGNRKQGQPLRGDESDQSSSSEDENTAN